MLELSPHWGLVVGNIRTGAEAGLTLRLGYNVPSSTAAARRRGEPPVELYALGAVNQRWVARDLFLDGNTFRASPRVDKEPLVSEARLGAGLRFWQLRIEYRAVRTSREYRTEARPHRYGSIIASIHRPY